MPGREPIRDAILWGVQSANETYETWSNGWWLTDSGVEGLLVASIAERLASERSEGESLMMEMPFRDILSWSGAGRRARRPRETLRGRHRADIVLLDPDAKPVCVIGVKRIWDRFTCFADLTRTRDLVIRCNDGRNGSLTLGFLALMLAAHATAHETAEQRLRHEEDRIRRAIRDEFDSRGLRLRCHAGPVRRYPETFRVAHGEVAWAHAGFCVELSSKNGRAG